MIDLSDVHRIAIRPFGERSCAVSYGIEPCENPRYFEAEAWAESAARDLAVRLVDQESPVEVFIGLRDGMVAGRFVAVGLPRAIGS